MLLLGHVKRVGVSRMRNSVGVGENSRQVCLTTYEELKMFLLSEESLYMYANSQVDIAALANLFNINVHIYTYCVQSWDAYGQRLPNRWTTTSPDPLLSSFNPIIPGEVADIVLYNEDTVHYDLLVREDSRLALQGTVPYRIKKMMKTLPAHPSAPPQSSPPPSPPAFSPTKCLSPSSQPLPSPQAARRLRLMECQGISPMNFPACPRGRGRPKLNDRQGAASEKRKADTTEEPSLKKRGRPKGSKNKCKETEAQKTLSVREIAELAAEGTSDC